MTDWNPVPRADRGPEPMDVLRYELERFKVDLYFSPEVVDAMRIETFQSQATRDLVYRLVGLVATWRKERLLRVPANWWQHFKQRWFPAWALKRWPVLYTVYDAAVVLPKVPVFDPKYHTVEFPVWQRRGET